MVFMVRLLEKKKAFDRVPRLNVGAIHAGASLPVPCWSLVFLGVFEKNRLAKLIILRILQQVTRKKM
jgi:hypothetical protein